MDSEQGHIQLDRAVATITVGARHRTDLGDITTLAESIARQGLLQPITLTPDGVLVCGARRLEAIKQLGWDTVKVWVRSGISGTLAHLLAEQDDNVLHKPLTQLENAALYREITELMREDAERRRAATQFSSDHQPGDDGPANFAGPSPDHTDTTSAGEGGGDRRKQAAGMIPGGASYATLDKITWLQNIAAHPDTPDVVRAETQAALDEIEQGAPVHPIYDRIKALVKDEAARRSQDAGQAAADALAKLQSQPRKKQRRTPSPGEKDGGDVELWSPRMFVHTWRAFDGWWDHFDVAILATKLSSAEVQEFYGVVEDATHFAEQLRTALATPPVADPAPRLQLV